MSWTPSRRAVVAVAVWLVAVVAAAWLSWAAIDSAGRQVVAPLPVATDAGASPATGTISAPEQTGSPTASPTGSPAPTPSGSAPGATHTVTTRGGTAAASCAGGAPAVDYATPADGWRADIEPEGGEGIRVEFRSEGERVRLAITCSGGVVQVSTEDRSESDDSGDD